MDDDDLMLLLLLGGGVFVAWWMYGRRPDVVIEEVPSIPGVGPMSRSIAPGAYGPYGPVDLPPVQEPEYGGTASPTQSMPPGWKAPVREGSGFMNDPTAVPSFPMPPAYAPLGPIQAPPGSIPASFTPRRTAQAEVDARALAAPPRGVPMLSLPIGLQASMPSPVRAPMLALPIQAPARALSRAPRLFAPQVPRLPLLATPARPVTVQGRM